MSLALSYFQTGFIFPRGPARTTLVRVGISIIMLWQLGGAALLTRPTAEDSVSWLGIFLGATLSLLLLTGILVPLTLVTLIIFWATPIATNLGFWSLGVEASTWALLGLLIAGGLPTSTETRLAHWSRSFARLSHIVYTVWGPLSPSRDFAARFVSLWFFSLTALYSVSLHRLDPFWLEGSLGSYLLSSNYLSRFYKFWDTVLSEPSLLSEGLSILVVAFLYIFGSIWLLIFFRGRVAALVVKMSTFGFFSFSVIFLQIGVLPFVEVLLWCFWFLPARNLKHNRHAREFRFAVFYDDYCGLCQNTRRILGRLDSTRMLIWIPATQVKDQLENLQLTYEEVSSNITAVRSDGEILSGFRFYLHVVWWIPSLVFAGPILFLGGLTRVGPAIYTFVRDRRRRNKSLCELTPRTDLDLATTNYQLALDEVLSRHQPTDHNGSSQRAFAYWSFGLALGILYVMSSPAVHTDFAKQVAALEPPLLQTLRYSLGLQPINVFNSPDLRLSEHWVTFYASDGMTKTEVVPITLEDGSRGLIQSIDSIVYAGTLPFRRNSIGQTPATVCDLALTLTGNPRVKRALDLLTPDWATSTSIRVYRQPLSHPTEGRRPAEELCAMPIGS